MTTMLIKKTQEWQEVKMILKYMVRKWKGMTVVIISEILIEMTYALTIVNFLRGNSYALSIIIHNIAS